MSDKRTTRGNPILAKFRAALTRCTAKGLNASSYTVDARGDAKPDSDYDIAVFIKDPDTFTEDGERLAAITTDVLVDTGAVISATPFPAGAYRDRTGFMHELRKDGLDL
jgi:uncharacterized protein